LSLGGSVGTSGVKIKGGKKEYVKFLNVVNPKKKPGGKTRKKDPLGKVNLQNYNRYKKKNNKNIAPTKQEGQARNVM